jgi:hypothetical protein
LFLSDLRESVNSAGPDSMPWRQLAANGFGADGGLRQNNSNREKISWT